MRHTVTNCGRNTFTRSNDFWVFCFSGRFEQLILESRTLGMTQQSCVQSQSYTCWCPPRSASTPMSECALDDSSCSATHFNTSRRQNVQQQRQHSDRQHSACHTWFQRFDVPSDRRFDGSHPLCHQKFFRDAVTLTKPWLPRPNLKNKISEKV